MKRFVWFVVVGSAAAAVHWGLVVALVGHFSWRPLLANPVAWLLAFVVSFSGHYFLTFKNHGVALVAAARRFFLISAAGFAINQTVYAILLQFKPQWYALLLAVVLVAVAGATYWLSQRWAFFRSPGP